MITQNQQQRQQLRILPQQIQLLNIFHLNTQELDLRILDELNENPLLEESHEEEIVSPEKNEKENVQDYMGLDEYCNDDIPDYKLEHNNYINSADLPDRPLVASEDFRTTLKQQFREQYPDHNDELVADYIIDSLNDCGLLDQPLTELADAASFYLRKWMEVEDLEKTLLLIQQLGPQGIGARNLQECLLIQLKQMDTRRPDVQKAISIIQDHYRELQTYSMEKIKASTGLEDDELEIVIKLIASLTTRPIVASAESQNKEYIIPDFILTEVDDTIEISLFRSRSSSLFVSNSWKEKVQENEANKQSATPAAQYLKGKLQSAMWFVNAIKERETNMLKIMRTIVDFQLRYFQTGNMLDLKPMILKDIAEKTNLDISTISRITSNKYASTTFGIVPLKKLFSEGLATNDGEKVSNRVIQQTINEIIKAEDKSSPLTDKEITDQLTKKGFAIARRTVAKYREQLHIPVAQQRGRLTKRFTVENADVES